MFKRTKRGTQNAPPPNFKRGAPLKKKEKGGKNPHTYTPPVGRKKGGGKKKKTPGKERGPPTKKFGEKAPKHQKK